MRASKEHHLKAMKIATFRLIDAAGNGEAVPVTRVKAPALSKYKATEDFESFIPIDVMFDLELLHGSPILTEALARLHGKRLVADERADSETDAATIRDRLDAIEDDVARLRLTAREAMEDSKIDALERMEIRRKMDRVRLALDELEGKL